MLADFLVEHRSEVLGRCLSKIRSSFPAAHDKSSDELIDDLTHFYDELIGALRKAGVGVHASGLDTTGDVACKHAAQRWHIGFDVKQVIHDYGFICDAITETAQEAATPIEVFEYRVMNQSIDTAIAEAVNEYQRQRDSAGEHRHGERLGSIVHELRNALATSVLSLRAIREGRLSIAGRTADALERSLRRQQQLIEYLVNDVRLRTGELQKSAVQLAQLLDEIEASAAVHARTKDIRLSADTDAAVELEGDRSLLTSALMNLTLNAIKYTPRGGRVHIRSRSYDGQACIEVEDECGGLPDGDHQALFQPFVQQHSDRAGLGLGLSITRESIEAHGGTVGVRNLPGKGCIFILQVPIRRPS